MKLVDTFHDVMLSPQSKYEINLIVHPTFIFINSTTRLLGRVSHRKSLHTRSVYGSVKATKTLLIVFK